MRSFTVPVSCSSLLLRFVPSFFSLSLVSAPSFGLLDGSPTGAGTGDGCCSCCCCATAGDPTSNSATRILSAKWSSFQLRFFMIFSNYLPDELDCSRYRLAEFPESKARGWIRGPQQWFQAHRLRLSPMQHSRMTDSPSFPGKLVPKRENGTAVSEPSQIRRGRRTHGMNCSW